MILWRQCAVIQGPSIPKLLFGCPSTNQLCEPWFRLPALSKELVCSVSGEGLASDLRITYSLSVTQPALDASSPWSHFPGFQYGWNWASAVWDGGGSDRGEALDPVGQKWAIRWNGGFPQSPEVTFPNIHAIALGSSCSELWLYLVSAAVLVPYSYFLPLQHVPVFPGSVLS